MRFSSLWISVAWVTAAVAVVAGAPPPALTPLFTATLNVAAPLIVPIPGGVRSGTYILVAPFPLLSGFPPLGLDDKEPADRYISCGDRERHT